VVERDAGNSVAEASESNGAVVVRQRVDHGRLLHRGAVTVRVEGHVLVDRLACVLAAVDGVDQLGLGHDAVRDVGRELAPLPTRERFLVHSEATRGELLGIGRGGHRGPSEDRAIRGRIIGLGTDVLGLGLDAVGLGVDAGHFRGHQLGCHRRHVLDDRRHAGGSAGGGDGVRRLGRRRLHREGGEGDGTEDEGYDDAGVGHDDLLLVCI